MLQAPMLSCVLKIRLYSLDLMFWNGPITHGIRWGPWIWYGLPQQYGDVLLTYTLQDNNIVFDANSVTWVIDDPITLGCPDPNWDMICGTVSSWSGTAEICTWGIDEDVDTGIDCADSDCFGSNLGGSKYGIRDWTEAVIRWSTTWCQACVWTWTGGCADGILNGSETDIDCGGSCLKCVNGRRCTLNSDCTSTNCAYNVLNDGWFLQERVLFDNPLWTQTQTVLPTTTENQQWRSE